MNWRSVISLNPAYRDISNWPRFDIRALPLNKRVIFHRNFSIVSCVLDGQPISDVATRFNLSHSLVCKIMNRCLVSKNNDDPPLTDALIPNKQLQKSSRRKALPTIAHGGGTRNCFEMLLKNVPNLQLRLDSMLTERIKDNPNAQVMTPRVFHGEFIRLLEQANWPKNQYPFNNASWAYESTRRYFHKRNDEIRLAAITPPIESALATDLSHYALREIQIDEQTADLGTCIHLELNNELLPVRLSRVNLLLAVDVDTDCYLGYHLAYTARPNQQDMLSLLKNILTPWQKMHLTSPGLAYVEGAGFPSGAPYHCSSMTFETVALDNALIHMANSVKNTICRDLGSTLNLGIKGKPKRRNWIELAFQTANSLNHRFASTTGSRPHDPKRESLKNSKKPPSVSILTMEEALSVILSRHNVMPQSRLGGATPLDTFSHHLKTQFVRMMPFKYDSLWSPLLDHQECKIKFSKYESRAPFINFYGVRYSGTVLCDPELLGSNVNIEFDRTDIRTLKVFDKTGKNKGIISAPKSWLRFRHSLHTRQFIIKEVRKKRLQGKDPLAEYFNALLSKVDSPEHALALTKLVKEANFMRSETPQQSQNNNHSECSNQMDIDMPSDINWTTDWAKHHG